MKMSFGGGRGMGRGGGGMLRSLKTIQRSVRVRAGAGGELEDPFCQSNYTTTTSTNNNNSFSNNTVITNTRSLSSSFSNHPLPNSCLYYDHEFEFESDWEYCIINGTQDQIFPVFGIAPSKDEAEYAVFAIQEFLKPGDFSDTDEDISSSGRVEPSLQLLSGGSDSVHEAFCLLQTEPSVQKMVISLSSDKAVWDAVMNNEVVRELRASLNEDGAANEKSTTASKDEKGGSTNAAMEILSRILFNAKAKMVELIEKITGLVYNLFTKHQITEDGIIMDPFEKKLKTSFLLSVVVFLVVAVSRSRRA